MSDVRSVLPSNTTSPELLLEQAMARTLDAYDVPVADLWSPDRCPLPLLPFLAWALSVDVWDEQWSETQMRAACRASLPAHRAKGTSRSVRDVVTAIYAHAEVIEWFEEDGRPGTFRIEMGELTGPRSWTLLLELVHHTKPIFIHLSGVTSRVDRQHAPRLGLAAHGAGRQSQPWHPGPLAADQRPRLGLGAHGAGRQVKPWRPEALVAQQRPCLGMGAHAVATQRSRWRQHDLAPACTPRLGMAAATAGMQRRAVPLDHPDRSALA